MFIRFYKIIIWIIVIGILCFTPGSEFKEVKINIPHFDKLVHFGMFYVLGLLLESLCYSNKKNKILWIVFSIVYAATIEIVQYYWIEMRNGDIVDFIFDLTGLFLAVYTFKLYPDFIRKMLK